MPPKRKAKPKLMQKNTWPQVNTESHTQITSSQGITSPLRGKAHRSESHLYHKVSVCHLECRSKDVCCQCVIVKLSPELGSALHFEDRHSMTLALIAPHTHLHLSNPKELREWRMQTGADSVHKSAGLKLNERYISHFYTCCGPHGVWGGSEIHTGKYIDENSCPFHANFTVLVLKPELTDQLKDELTIPYLPSLNENHFSQALHSGNLYFTLIKREESGVSEAHKVLLKRPSSLVGNELSIEERITAYAETAQVQYTCGHVSFFDDKCAGAGVVYFDQTTPDNALMLAAVHLYSRRDDEEITHCGISLPAIFHAIAGSRVCGVIPCLSLLVGACNHGRWKLRFYQDLQDCLHPRNDPVDKQKRYHWISQLLTVCDYISRDEAQVVLRLDVTDSTQIVLASINLLSALLGCFQRVIDSEGVSQFHCQISRVFLKKASEQFYRGLEGVFKRLYKHLLYSSSGDDVIILCVECWLKMCTLVGTKLSAFYEVAKFTRVKVLRDSPRFRNNAHFQWLFGDLCLAFLTHTRMLLHNSTARVDGTASTARIQQLEQEKQALQSRVDRMHQELTRARDEIHTRERECMITNGDLDDSVFSEPDMAAVSPPPTVSLQLSQNLETVLRFDSQKSFWDRDMSSLLEGDHQLRNAIGKVFQRVTGAAGNGSWELLVQHLGERLDATDNFMELDGLSALEESEGDNVLLIVQEWTKREEVTASLFHEVSRKLGNGDQIHDILSQMEQAERDRTLPSFGKQNAHRNSETRDI